MCYNFLFYCLFHTVRLIFERRGRNEIINCICEFVKVWIVLNKSLRKCTFFLHSYIICFDIVIIER